MLTRPAREKVFLKRLNKEVTLNFITIEDEEWLAEQWSTEELNRLWSQGDLNVILTVFWRFLDDDSKRLVAGVKLVRWEGAKEVVVKTTDPVEILKSVISGADEAKAIVQAMYGMRVKSNEQTEAVEKKSLKAAGASVSQKSSTSSVQNTDSVPQASAS